MCSGGVEEGKGQGKEGGVKGEQGEKGQLH